MKVRGQLKRACTAFLASIVALVASEAAHAGACLIPSGDAGLQESLRQGGSLAACPRGEGFRPLSNVHPVRSLVVGYRSRALIEALAQWALANWPATPILLVVPDDKLEEARAELPSLLVPPYSSFFQWHVTEAMDTAWVQDMMETGVTGAANTPALLDLPNYSNDGPEDAPGELASSCGLALVAQDDVSYESEPETSERGGNIEAFPGGVVAIGNNMDPGLRAFLRKQTGQSPVAMDVSWLAVGHVDEIVSVVPSAHPCGFSLLRASPALALELLDGVARETPSASLEPRLSSDGEAPAGVTKLQTGGCVHDWPRAKYSRPLEAREAWDCRELLELNRGYEKRIAKSTEKLKAAIARATGCRAVEEIPLPVLFRPEPVFAAEYAHLELPHAKAEAVTPNPVNALVVGRTAFVGAPTLPHFEREISARLGRAGVTPVYVDSSPFHHAGGNIHCGTHAIRACR